MKQESGNVAFAICTNDIGRFTGLAGASQEETRIITG